MGFKIQFFICICHYDGWDCLKWKRVLTMSLRDAGLWDMSPLSSPIAVRDATRTKKNKALLGVFWNCESSWQDLVEDELDARAV